MGKISTGGKASTNQGFVSRVTARFALAGVRPVRARPIVPPASTLRFAARYRGETGLTPPGLRGCARSCLAVGRRLRVWVGCLVSLGVLPCLFRLWFCWFCCSLCFAVCWVRWVGWCRRVVVGGCGCGFPGRAGSGVGVSGWCVGCGCGANLLLFRPCRGWLLLLLPRQGADSISLLLAR